MIPRRLYIDQVHGLPPIELDLDTDGLIAIAGPNGCGKSTVMGAMCPAPLWLRFPDYQGHIKDRFTGDGTIALHLGHGNREYTLTVNAIKGVLKASMNVDDESVVQGKVREYSEEVSRRFPPEHTTLASVFSAQSGTGDILSLPQSQQRDLLATLLGLDEIQEKWERARKYLRALVGDQVIIRDRLRNAREAQVQATGIRLALQDIQGDIDKANADLTPLCVQQGELELVVKRERAILDEAERLRNLLGNARVRLVQARRKRPAEVVDLAGMISNRNKRKRLKEDQRTQQLDIADYWRSIEDLRQKSRTLAMRIDEANDRASLVNRVPCEGESMELRDGEIVRFNECPLLADAKKAPVSMAEDQAELGRIEAELDLAHDDLGNTEEYLVRIETELSTLPDVTEQAIREAEVAQAQDQGALARETTMLEREIVDLQTEHDSLDEVGSEEANTHREDLARLARKVRQIEEDIRSCSLDRERNEGKLETLAPQAEKVDELEAEFAALDRRIAGAELLVRGLGREGIQALEIDAAGPRISDLATSLLATIEPRFSLRIRTLREGDKRRKTVERLDIIVLDSEQPGVERTVFDLSKGQRVVVGEALKLGIAVANAERWGVACQTLWRDECDGALDDEHARRYPAMLRKAMEIGGFVRCYFVSHRPAVVAQADDVIVLGG
jgi:DNA repair exonuclease SbcCD ATPase subunit